MEVWNIIVQSNTFNFIVLVILFAIIIKVCKISSLLDNAISKVKETIDNAINSKEKAIEELKKAEEEILKTPEEIEEIEKNADKNIALLEENIAKEAQKQVDLIENNVQKALERKQQDTFSSLSNKTIEASFELAKNHIKHLLEIKPEYHQKFIAESIKELDRLQK